MLSVKCSAEGPDYSRTKVLTELFCQLSLEDGGSNWQFHWWEQDVLVRKGSAFAKTSTSAPNSETSSDVPLVGVRFKIPYLRDRHGNLVTIQHKAWVSLSDRRWTLSAV